MRRTQHLLALVFIALWIVVLQVSPNAVVAASDDAGQYAGLTADVGTYVPGGRNVESYRYVHSDGYPPFSDKVEFIGTLTGTWYDMGVQFGQRSGEQVRYVSDIWWNESCTGYGKAQTLKAMGLFESQIAALDPNLVAFMRGIADGAGRWLSQSIYADPSNPLHSTNYQRVLAVNIYDDWVMNHPSVFPDGSSTCGGSYACPSWKGIAHSCSAFVARGNATVGHQTIAAHDRQIQYDPRTYAQAYVIKPQQGNTAWVLSNCPQVAANQVVNEKGVTVILLWGGATTDDSSKYNLYAEGFGVPWFSLFLYVGTHASTMQEAIQMLTVGTADYLKRTGRKSLLRGGGWNFLVADRRSMAVVEVTADRYAVRYPGQFTGSDWTSPDYIVAANHFLCDFSYDANNHRTNVPMSIFNWIFPEDTITRFWTLMWDMKQRYGLIDKYMAEYLMAGRYKNDKDTGARIDCVVNPQDNGLYVFGDVYGCSEGTGVGMYTGSADGKVSILKDHGSEVYWTLGTPSHWVGEWDAFYFNGGGH